MTRCSSVTGRWARRANKGPWNVGLNAAGLHASVGERLKGRGVALIGRDAALDVVPSLVEGQNLPVHTLATTALGLNIFDNQDLGALGTLAAGQKRWEFMLTVAPVPVTGGTGFPVNALATFWAMARAGHTCHHLHHVRAPGRRCTSTSACSGWPAEPIPARRWDGSETPRAPPGRAPPWRS